MRSDDSASGDDRLAALRDLEDWLERPMLVLSFAWLALFLLEFTRGLPPVLEWVGSAIWAAFVLDFVLRLALAPDRTRYLRANWLTAISLLVPAVRVLRLARAFRVLRVARATRGLRLVKVVGSLNRGMRALGRSFARRGFGYVVALTVLVSLAGAAGMYAFERDVPESPLTSYGAALWWTAMVMTTMGSDYFPRSAEGRALCVLLALFAFAVFGYVTATLATYFVGRDAAAADAEVAGQAAVDTLSAEVRALRSELRALVSRLDERTTGPAVPPS
ncbi:MAG TPA: ion transporter [Gemmatirosa sp.]|nr:ion transporter [Gemmatirosa sp.]